MRKTKRFMKWHIARGFISAFVALVVFSLRADTEFVNGYTWNYRIIDDTAEICGTSSNLVVNPAISPLPSGVVTIPSMLGGKILTSIGSEAFYNCSGITGVVIPASVTNIGERAFSQCTGLSAVTLPANVFEIGESAFDGCSSLRYVDLPAHLFKIGSYAFNGCPLVVLDIPNGVSHIGDRAFFGKRYSRVVIPASVIQIGCYAFGYGGGGMEPSGPDEIVFEGAPPQCDPQGEWGNVIGTYTRHRTAWGQAISHGYYESECETRYLEGDNYYRTVFGRIWRGIFMHNPLEDRFGYRVRCNWDSEIISGSSYLIRLASRGDDSTLVIPKMLGGFPVRGIGYCYHMDGRWEDYYSSVYVEGASDMLKSVIIPDGVEGIGSNAFSCLYNLEHVAIPSSVLYIGARAFAYTRLQDLTLPEGVTEISEELCADCCCLSAVTIPYGVAEIGIEAFRGCSSLTKVSIPNSVIKIGSGAFSGTGITSLTIPASVVQFAGDVGVCNLTFEGPPPAGAYEEGEGDAELYLSSDTVLRYPVAYSNRWAEVIARCGIAQAEAYDSEMLGMDGPLTGIDNGFAYTVDADGSVSITGFSGASGAVVLPTSVNGFSPYRIAEAAFAGHDEITYIVIPPGYCEIADSAFERCHQLASVTLPDTIYTIGNSAFRECVALTNVVIPAFVNKIGVFAFRDCKKLASLQLQPPANVMGRKIGVGAFDGVPARTQSTGAEGLVCVVWEVKGSGAIAVPDTWAAKYPDFADAFGANLAQALVKPSGKRAADGSPMYVWQDYVAGTDPTDLNDVFKATISYVDGEPLVSWTPELPPEQAALRKYTIYGKAKLSDADWSVINGNASAYNFFKVTVEMK